MLNNRFVKVCRTIKCISFLSLSQTSFKLSDLKQHSGCSGICPWVEPGRTSFSLFLLTSAGTASLGAEHPSWRGSLITVLKHLPSYHWLSAGSSAGARFWGPVFLFLMVGWLSSKASVRREPGRTCMVFCHPTSEVT